MRWLLLLLLLALPVLPAQADPALLSALRQPGMVVFLRHGETGAPWPDQATAVLGECDTQRALDETGRAQARAIGEAFRALDLRVARVLASPFCRTMETAVLAFGQAMPEMALSLPRHVDAAAQRAMGADLLALVASLPREGLTVLVGHSYHLMGAGGPRPDPQGAAAILRPREGGGFETLALLPPEAWQALARRRLASLGR